MEVVGIPHDVSNKDLESTAGCEIPSQDVEACHVIDSLLHFCKEKVVTRLCQ